MPHIATKTVDVYDPNLGFTRQVIAGQPVPPDLVSAYEQETGQTAEGAERDLLSADAAKDADERTAKAREADAADLEARQAAQRAAAGATTRARRAPASGGSSS